MSAELWILGGTFVAGAGATALSWGGAISAGRRERKAEAAQAKAEAARDEALELSRKATAAFERQAAAQEEANRLEVEARMVPTWTGPQFVSEKVNAMVNTSGRDIVVEAVNTIPESASGLLRVIGDGPAPYQVIAGGSLRLMTLTRWASARFDLISIEWRFADETEISELRVSLV